MATWANDALDAEPLKGKSEPANDYLNFDSDSGQDSEAGGAADDPEGKALPCTRESLRAVGHALMSLHKRGSLGARPCPVVGVLTPAAGPSALTDLGHLLVQSVTPTLSTCRVPGTALSTGHSSEPKTAQSCPRGAVLRSGERHGEEVGPLFRVLREDSATEGSRDSESSRGRPLRR